MWGYHGKSEEFSARETAKRRDEVLKKMLNTPPKPRVARPQSRVQNPKKAGEGQKSDRRKPDPDA
jgi:hypothetical protein